MLASKVFSLDIRVLCQRMVGMDNDHQLVLEQRLEHDLSFPHGPENDAEVELSFKEKLHGP